MCNICTLLLWLSGAGLVAQTHKCGASRTGNSAPAAHSALLTLVLLLVRKTANVVGAFRVVKGGGVAEDRVKEGAQQT